MTRFDRQMQTAQAVIDNASPDDEGEGGILNCVNRTEEFIGEREEIVTGLTEILAEFCCNGWPPDEFAEAKALNALRRLRDRVIDAVERQEEADRPNSYPDHDDREAA